MESQRTKQKHSTDEKMGCPSLPHDIIIDILYWVPAKSLMRFKRVSKSWQELIKNPSFIKMHLQHTSSTSNEHFSLMVNGKDDDDDIDSLYTVDYFHGESSSGKLVKLGYPFNRCAYNSVTIVGSCHGLFCIRVEDHYCDPIICIWNPSTSEYKGLPSKINVVDDWLGTEMYAFGYDCKNDDYKVVCVEPYHLEDSDSGRFRYAVQVYTLGIDSWRRIEDLPYGTRVTRTIPPRVLVNGAIHWLVQVYSDDYKVCKIVILAIDLGDETYDEMPLPDCFNNDADFFDDVDSSHNYVAVNLGVLNGSLCLRCNVDHTHLDVWMMKDYGVKTSWIIVVTIPEHLVDSGTCKLNKILPGQLVGETGNDGTSSQSFSRVQINIVSTSCFADSDRKYFVLQPKISTIDNLKLIKMVKHGDIIVNVGCQSSFRLYGPSYERAKNLNIKGSVEAYVGSLVSLNSGLYMEPDKLEEDKDEKEEVG